MSENTYTPGGMPVCHSHDRWNCETCFPWGWFQVCAGCGVREPFEHRCLDSQCTCVECREADRLFGFDPA